MPLLAALLTVVLPVALVAGVGALLGRRFAIDIGTITKISLNALTPALAFQTILTTEVTVRTGLLLGVTYVVTSLLGAALGYGATPGLTGHTRRSVAVAVAIGNNGNMGLPIALFALGRPGLDQAVVVFILSVILTFVLAPLLYGAHTGVRRALTGMARLPALWAMVAAMALRWSGIRLPVGILRGIELLAQATLPMILLTLGIQLGATGRVRLTRPVVTAVLCRVGAMPLVGLGVGLALGLRGIGLQTMVLASAMPSAVNTFLLAHEYEGDTETVAHAVTVSTLVAFVTTAVVTALLPVIGAL